MTTMTFRALATIAVLFAVPTAGWAQGMSGPNEPLKTIVQVAVEAGRFRTLVTALEAAGLVETLQGPGRFTVFAPNDAAFAKLPAGAVEALLADQEKLTAVLTYHVVPGLIMAADIVKAQGARPATVNGAPLDIVLRDGKVYVNGAQVVTADIVTSNGVIHVIDTVLMPSAADAPEPR